MGGSKNGSSSDFDIVREAVLTAQEIVPFGPILVFTSILLLIIIALVYRYGLVERCTSKLRHMSAAAERSNVVMSRTDPVIPIISHNLNNKWISDEHLKESDKPALDHQKIIDAPEIAKAFTIPVTSMSDS